MNTRRSTSYGASLFVARPTIHSVCSEVSTASVRRASARAVSDASGLSKATCVG
ncbi:hypothetical protein [Streptomyces glycanivorans]|uniref:Uncharacterized protein n=1 Tax=Streptomyces glycanivorans TaxID=3033808 RepID=A0ABY9JPK1_9ACTN|nr:hypothetical protein [Streptomyces sp. Alt3]WLQ68548.1 hypothetical protein P8A20_35560 [Streptomyces sp. Alt3]